MVAEKRFIGRVTILRKIWKTVYYFCSVFGSVCMFLYDYIVSAEEVSAEEYSRMSQQLVEDSLRPVASCENQCNE